MRRALLLLAAGGFALLGPGNVPASPPTTFPGPYDASTGVTPTEYAAEACVEPQAPLRAAGGDVDLCYERTVALARGAEVLSPALSLGSGR